jgi:anti-anti-sigma factor
VKTPGSRDGRSTHVVAVVELRGELDLETAKDLSWAVDEALRQGLDCVDLDTSHLTSLDSNGLSAIVRARQHVREHDQQFRVSGVQPWLHRLLERTGLLDVLGVER